MLLLKLPVQVTLPEASSGPHACPSTGSDTPSDKSASAEGTTSQDIRRFAPKLESMVRPFGTIPISALPDHRRFIPGSSSGLQLVCASSSADQSATVRLEVCGYACAVERPARRAQAETGRMSRRAVPDPTAPTPRGCDGGSGASRIAACRGSFDIDQVTLQAVGSTSARHISGPRNRYRKIPC